MDALADALDGYLWFHTSRAEMQAQVGQLDDARRSLHRASELWSTDAQRHFIQSRMAALDAACEGDPR